MTTNFAEPPSDKRLLDEARTFTPRFDQTGLLTVVVTDAGDGGLLMVAHMNTEALTLTIETGIAHYWSRSRRALWKKGETSGNLQTVVEMRTDCDQDCVWLKVRTAGHDAACHTGRKSCFYRVVKAEDGGVALVDDGQPRLFDHEAVYGA